ncbi:MAG: hypothetical protein IKQ41_05435 [Clostridia bacterium]|nr:hypothetical protein [Clostridia bacterium]
MAYCVHCGVRLEAGEKKCPLCMTPVYDPSAPPEPEAPRAYPVRTPEQELKRNKRFLLMLFTVMMVAPAFLCLVIDWMLSGAVTWSGYASSALALLFISVAVPLIMERYQAYWAVGTGFVCLNVYLFLVEKQSNSGRWFFPIALPALALFTVMLTVIILLFRRGKLNKLTLIASLCAAAALECVAIEWLRMRALQLHGGFAWSPFVLAPCLIFALSLFFINGNRVLREEVRRKVHF